MKKIKYLLLILPFLFIDNVKAESIEYNYAHDNSYFSVENYSEFQTFLNDNNDIITILYKNMFDEYNDGYSSNYPYYIIQMDYVHSTLNFNLLATDSPLYFKVNGNSHGETYFEDSELFVQDSSNYIYLISSYSFENSTYVLPIIGEYVNVPAHYGFQPVGFFENFFLDSNYDLKIYTDFDSIIINNYRDTNSDYVINSGDIYPTYYKNGNIINPQRYKEINLNDYAYIALSLKDYNQEVFDTITYVKGQYCITPVYNYGMTERKDILTGTQVQRCTPYYDDYTIVRTSILSSDIQNNSIYYLKSYDITKENYVKVDTSVFNITYITEEEKDQPYVTIMGVKYPTIPYDNLTDTATKSEEEGYISGESEKFNFADLFTAPLEILKNLWNSITSVFSLVTEFFSLLPEPLPTFLLVSFTIAIILGLIKIIL